MPRVRPVVLFMVVMLIGSMGPVSATSAAADEPARARWAEKYAMRLLNCTRSGGWVSPSGTCRAKGSGKYSLALPALKRSWGISNKVAWPWAGTLVVENECEHELPGHPTVRERFTSRGFDHWGIGENIGCAWGHTPKSAVLSTHRAMQAEKSYDGGHWRNMKDAGWKRVGVAVAKRGGVVMVVYDFYRAAVR